MCEEEGWEKGFIRRPEADMGTADSTILIPKIHINVVLSFTTFASVISPSLG